MKTRIAVHKSSILLFDSIFFSLPFFQKYKPHNNGASNQKWNYMKSTKAFMAFHSTSLDKEITAANYAGVCTSSVIREENIDQPVSGSSSYKKDEGGMG